MCKEKKETKKKSKTILTQEAIRKAADKAAQQTNEQLGLSNTRKNE